MNCPFCGAEVFTRLSPNTNKPYALIDIEEEKDSPYDFDIHEVVCKKEPTHYFYINAEHVEEIKQIEEEEKNGGN